MNLTEFEHELKAYSDFFDNFRREIGVGTWFSTPDHVAIKCADELDYLKTCDAFMPQAQDGVWEAEIDERMLASAQLAGMISIAGYKFSWLEIMQPRPGKETDKGYVEHAEFMVRDLDEVYNGLQASGIEGVERQANEGHTWINVPIPGTEGKREIKFTNQTLKSVTDCERTTGKLHRIQEE